MLISCYDAVLLQREANFIQSFRQAMLTERLDGKLKSILKRRGNALRVEIDVNGLGFRHLKQPVYVFPRHRACQYAILDRIARKNIGQDRLNDGLPYHVSTSTGRAFSDGSAPEIVYPQHKRPT